MEGIKIPIVRGSDSIGQLAAALAAAQAEIKAAAKDSENPHFKAAYADLASVWEACRGPLSKNGLAVIQLPSADGSKVTVQTVLAHKSGEWISGELVLTAAQNTPQGVGSAITYGRRYGLAAIAGVAPDDDDGEGAEGRGKQPPQTQRPAQERPKAEPPKATKPTRISDQQQRGIFGLMESAGKTADEVRDIVTKHGFQRTADITTDHYEAICKAIKGE